MSSSSGSTPTTTRCRSLLASSPTDCSRKRDRHSSSRLRVTSGAVLRPAAYCVFVLLSLDILVVGRRSAIISSRLSSSFPAIAHHHGRRRRRRRLYHHRHHPAFLVLSPSSRRADVCRGGGGGGGGGANDDAQQQKEDGDEEEPEQTKSGNANALDEEKTETNRGRRDDGGTKKNANKKLWRSPVSMHEIQEQIMTETAATASSSSSSSSSAAASSPQLHPNTNEQRGGALTMEATKQRRTKPPAAQHRGRFHNFFAFASSLGSSTTNNNNNNEDPDASQLSSPLNVDDEENAKDEDAVETESSRSTDDDTSHGESTAGEQEDPDGDDRQLKQQSTRRRQGEQRPQLKQENSQQQQQRRQQSTLSKDANIVRDKPSDEEKRGPKHDDDDSSNKYVEVITGEDGSAAEVVDGSSKTKRPLKRAVADFTGKYEYHLGDISKTIARNIGGDGSTRRLLSTDDLSQQEQHNETRKQAATAPDGSEIRETTMNTTSAKGTRIDDNVQNEEAVISTQMTDSTSTEGGDGRSSALQTPLSVPELPSTTDKAVVVTTDPDEVSPYVSSGLWKPIDAVVTLGLSEYEPSWRLSRRLRGARKATARITGLHGLMSGKQRQQRAAVDAILHSADNAIADMEDTEEEGYSLGLRRQRQVAIERASEKVKSYATKTAAAKERRGFFGLGREPDLESLYSSVEVNDPEVEEDEQRRREEERRRRERVMEIDSQTEAIQQQLQALACEKDVLQRCPNPLWSYSTEEREGNHSVDTREFIFPSDDLVDEYLNGLFLSNRLVRMNHTDLWRNNGGMDDDDDDDELVSPRGTRKNTDTDRTKRNHDSNGSDGHWLLRQRGLGEKIGVAAETGAYKAICKSVMSALAKAISAMHGITVMNHSDIQLREEPMPPPLPKHLHYPKNVDYAQEYIKDAMRSGARKGGKKRRKRRPVDDPFIQREAVVETLLSNTQIAAPIMKVFPLAWQRSLLGNIVTLVTCVMADFCQGLEFHILGHKLTFAFTPITIDDFNREIRNRTQFATREQFEAAVKATALDIGEGLDFLDKWHERLLGGDALRAQIAQLIARLVLSLVDDILTGSRMDLWTTNAGGPRMSSGLVYRADVIDVVAE